MKMFTYQQAYNITQRCLAEEKAKWEKIYNERVLELRKKYDFYYSLSFVNVMASEPYNFSREQIVEFAGTFNSILDALMEETIELDDMIQLAHNLNFRIETENNISTLKIE
jgi:hypothetical protein